MANDLKHGSQGTQAKAIPLQHDNVAKGIFFILLSALGFAAMTLFVKLAGDIGPMQKTFFRNIVAALVAYLMLRKSGQQLAWPKSSGALLVLRSVLGTLGILLNFYSVDHLLLGDANILQKISPFVIIILSAVLFKERITKFQLLCLCLGFIGIAFVVRPSGTQIISLGAAAAIVGAICAGSAYTCVRGLAKQGVAGSFIVFFFSAFSVVVLAPYVITHYEAMSAYQWLMMLGIGLSSALGQFGITYGYAYAPAKSVSVFEYMQVVFAALFGFIFFAEIPDLYSWIGYALISGVGIAMILKGAKK